MYSRRQNKHARREFSVFLDVFFQSKEGTYLTDRTPDLTLIFAASNVSHDASLTDDVLRWFVCLYQLAVQLYMGAVNL